MIHCYEKEQNTKEQKHIVPDALVSPRINEGHLRGGLGKTAFAFMDEISLALRIFQFPASRMFSVVVLYHEFFRQESQN